jgi:hypothetical protein
MVKYSLVVPIFNDGNLAEEFCLTFLVSRRVRAPIGTSLLVAARR